MNTNIKSNKLYKVARVESGCYYSVNFPREHFSWSPFSLRYDIGKEVKPQIGKIFVFHNLELAIHFIKDELPTSGKYVILEVVGYNPKKAQRKILLSNMTEEILQRYWNGETLCIYLIRPPIGTYLVDKVKVMEEVEFYKQGIKE